MEIEFEKMHGAGNDYLFIDARNQTLPPLGPLAVSMSARHTGIGADGIVLITEADQADFGMRIFNADGSEGLMCGNALRCLGLYVAEHQLTCHTALSVSCAAGKRYIRIVPGKEGAEVEASMGKPAFPVGDRQIILTLGPRLGNVRLTVVNVGNPHAVLFTDFPQFEDVHSLGTAIEKSPLFPDGINVEFASIVGPNTLRARVWERGSGETLACGTGACAVAVAAVMRRYAEKGKPVDILMPGGRLTVVMRANGSLLLRGPCQSVFRGIFEYKEQKHAD